MGRRAWLADCALLQVKCSGHPTWKGCDVLFEHPEFKAWQARLLLYIEQALKKRILSLDDQDTLYAQALARGLAQVTEHLFDIKQVLARS